MTNLIKNVSFAKFAKGAAGAVFATTALKAVVRPAFIMSDKKNNDVQAKKYTATKEFLYQALCFGIAIALLPFFERGGFRMAEKKLKNIKGLEKITKLNQIKEFADVNGIKKFKKVFMNKTFDANSTQEKSAKDAMNLVNGGLELGSFVGSILGLTIIAPIISHKILHPIMHALGMENSKKSHALMELEQTTLPEDHHNIDTKI